MSTAGSYGVVCQGCYVLNRLEYSHSDVVIACNTCDFHLARLREQSAIAAMSGILSDPNSSSSKCVLDGAIRLADALIERLMK